MRALVWKGGTTLEYQELPDPSAKSGEVVLQIELTGICGSDMHAYRGHPGPRKPPLILGHEAVARHGDRRVVVYPLIGCGNCDRCAHGEDNLCASWQLVGMHLPGTFAEQLTVPEASLYPVPDSLGSERAALTEPLACALGALGGHTISEDTKVLVLGCGTIGLLSVLLAADAGANVVAVDPLASRRHFAKRLGAQACAESAGDLRAEEADLVVDAAGFQTTWQAALKLVRGGGDVVVVGLGDAEGTLPMATVVRRSVRLCGQFAYSRAQFESAIEILTKMRIDLAWVAEAPLSQGAQAFNQLAEHPERHIKTLLKPVG